MSQRIVAGRLSVHPDLLPATKELLSEYVLLPDSWQGYEPVPTEPPDFFNGEFDELARLNPDDGDVVLVKVGRTPAGVGRLLRVNRQIGELKRIYVRDAFRRRGIGSVIVLQLITIARELEVEAD